MGNSDSSCSCNFRATVQIRTQTLSGVRSLAVARVISHLAFTTLPPVMTDRISFKAVPPTPSRMVVFARVYSVESSRTGLPWEPGFLSLGLVCGPLLLSVPLSRLGRRVTQSRVSLSRNSQDLARTGLAILVSWLGLARQAKLRLFIRMVAKGAISHVT